MDLSSFVESLLAALADLEDVERVALRTEGPVLSGRAYLHKELFLAFYYNQTTGTEAFALVRGTERIWGIDYDNIRGWHQHPVEAPHQHVAIQPQSVSAIIQQLSQVLARQHSSS